MVGRLLHLVQRFGRQGVPDLCYILSPLLMLLDRIPDSQASIIVQQCSLVAGNAEAG